VLPGTVRRPGLIRSTVSNVFFLQGDGFFFAGNVKKIAVNVKKIAGA
jgi:hypothetical protein